MPTEQMDMHACRASEIGDSTNKIALKLFSDNTCTDSPEFLSEVAALERLTGIQGVVRIIADGHIDINHKGVDERFVVIVTGCASPLTLYAVWSVMIAASMLSLQRQLVVTANWGCSQIQMHAEMHAWRQIVLMPLPVKEGSASPAACQVRRTVLSSPGWTSCRVR